MRFILPLALGLAVAGAAKAQFQPIAPIRPIQPLPSIGLPKPPTAAPPAGFKPYEPPAAYKPYAGTSTYDDGPFSPSAEARRAKRAAEPPAGGTFAPHREPRHNPF